jgi:hypothetical protein
MTDFICPEAEYHGKPFRYCPVKGCGWMEETHPVSPEALLAQVRSAVWTLHYIVPGFWWSSPPNQATADVVSGIIAVEGLLPPTPDGWRQGNAT